MSDIGVLPSTADTSVVPQHGSVHLGLGDFFFTVILDPLCSVNPLKPELNPICYLLALLGAHHFLHVSRIRVKLLTLR